MSNDATLIAPERATRLQQTWRAARSRRVLPVLFVLLGIIVVWEGAKLLGVSDQKLPHISAVFGQFLVRTRGGTGPLWIETATRNGAVTFAEALAGFVLGGLLGCGLAVLFAASRLLERGLLPYVVGSQTVPILAIAPMVVVGLGQLNMPSWFAKAVVAAYLTFFPVTIGMLRGLRSVSPDAVSLMRSYAASPVQMFFKLRLPSSLPYLFTSLKIAATASVIGAIIAELPAGSQEGIGLMILNSAQYYNSRPSALYASVLVASAVGLLFYGMVVLAERLVVKKRET